MKKLTLILAAMVLTASQAFGQCGKCGYEVKAENAYTMFDRFLIGGEGTVQNA